MATQDSVLQMMAVEIDELKLSYKALQDEYKKLQQEFDKLQAKPTPEAPITPPIASIRDERSSEYKLLSKSFDEMEAEFRFHASNVQGSVYRVNERMTNIGHRITGVSQAFQLNVDMFKRMNSTLTLYTNKTDEIIQKLDDYKQKIDDNPPIVELTQWKRVTMAAKSWINKSFLSDFRVIVLIIYMLMFLASTIHFGLKCNKLEKQNIALEYFIKRHIDMARRK